MTKVHDQRTQPHGWMEHHRIGARSLTIARLAAPENEKALRRGCFACIEIAQRSSAAIRRLEPDRPERRASRLPRAGVRPWPSEFRNSR
jgi:hypothetical protein